MITLILDTSHKFLSVGIAKDSKLIYSKQDILKQKQSEYLITYIQDVLESSKIDKRDIDRIVVTEGPGSYTGLRIAMTFVKVFSLTQKIEVYTINTLLSISGLRTGFSFIDARSKRIFGGYVCKGEIHDERIYTVDELSSIKTDFYGDLELINETEIEINISQNILDLEKSWQHIENVDVLVPRYFK